MLQLTQKVVNSEPGEDSLISAIHDANRVLCGVEARAGQHLFHLDRNTSLILYYNRTLHIESGILLLLVIPIHLSLFFLLI